VSGLSENLNENEENQSLIKYDDISRCSGTDGCYGITVGSIDPAIIEFAMKPLFMVVTEQPLGSAEGLRRGIENESMERGVPVALSQLFDGRFYVGIKSKKIYWTHFIKCPGRIRGRRRGKKGRSGLKIDACAKKFLRKEIEDLEPEVIITVGANASKFVLTMGGLGDDWQTILWKEIEAVATNRQGEFQAPVVRTSRVLVFMHPSMANPLRFLFLKLKPLLYPYMKRL